jgi:hypothetical protein
LYRDAVPHIAAVVGDLSKRGVWKCHDNDKGGQARDDAARCDRSDPDELHDDLRVGGTGCLSLLVILLQRLWRRERADLLGRAEEIMEDRDPLWLRHIALLESP